MVALTDRYPDSVAFLNVREENDLVEHCAAASHNPNFQLWGLDQELMGSAGWLLDQMLATHPGPAATAVLTRMKAEEQKDAALAKDAGDPSKVFLFAASDAQLSEIAAVLKREGNAAANELFHELVESHEIYLKNMQGSPEANRQRARLMKQNFQRDFPTRRPRTPNANGYFSSSAIGTFTKASTPSRAGPGQLHRRNGRRTGRLVTPHLHSRRQGHARALCRIPAANEA